MRDLNLNFRDDFTENILFIKLDKKINQFCYLFQKNQEIEKLLSQLEDDTAIDRKWGSVKDSPAHKTVVALRGNGSVTQRRGSVGQLLLDYNVLALKKPETISPWRFNFSRSKIL